jgi:hypothetical protein
MHRGDDDSSAIETTIVFSHCPPDITEATGMKTMVTLSLMVWSDTDESSTRALLEKYTKDITGTAMPSSRTEILLNPHTVAADVFQHLYPKGRYLCNAYFGDDSYLNAPDEDIFQLVEPLARSWMPADDALPGPSSHSLFVLMHKNMNEVNGGRELAYGFVPSFETMSYAIYDDENMDESNWQKLEQGMSAVSEAPRTWTVLAEGNIRNGKASFSNKTMQSMSGKLQILDPDGIFQKQRAT